MGHSAPVCRVEADDVLVDGSGRGRSEQCCRGPRGFVTIRPRPIHCTPYVAKVRARHALVDVRSVGCITSVELVELELLELASSSSSSDLTDGVVPLVSFLELSLDGRSDVAALAVQGVGRVGVFLIDE
eukprot:g25253.t1